MHLLALGLNHTTAPLAIRERVAFGPEETAETIGRVLSRLSGEESGHITEALILSTCNRTELYCAAEDPDLAIGALEAFLAEEKNLSISELTPHTYALTDLEVVEHAFCVASGLDSMVLGETQIVGQMKKAEKAARKAHGLGLMLNTLFQRTFTVAKEVRTATEIGAHTVSMSAAMGFLPKARWGLEGKQKLRITISSGAFMLPLLTIFYPKAVSSFGGKGRPSEKHPGVIAALFSSPRLSLTPCLQPDVLTALLLPVLAFTLVLIQQFNSGS